MTFKTSFQTGRDGLRTDERGGALVIALLVLLVLSTMAVTFVAVTKTEKQISGNQLRESQSLYVAEAGISEAMARMSNSSSASYIGEDPSSPTPGWGRYIVLTNSASAADPECALTQSDGLDNNNDASIDEAGEAYPEVLSCQVGLQNVIEYPWVKVTYKLRDVGGVSTVVLFGDHDSDPSTKAVENITVGFPVLVVTSNGVRSNARKTVEIEAVQPPGAPIQGSVYTEGSIEFKGTAFHIDGHDYDPATGEIVVGSTPLPGIAAAGGIGDVDCNTPQGWDNIEGSSAAPSVVTAPYDVDLDALFQLYASMADVVYNGDQANPDDSGWGDIDDYKVVCIYGDLHTSGACSGGGVLLIEGDYKCSGQFTWYGLIICLGDIEFTGGGTGKHVYGCTMVKGSLTSTSSVSGNADLYYSSQALSKLPSAMSYTVSLWTEK